MSTLYFAIQYTVICLPLFEDIQRRNRQLDERNHNRPFVFVLINLCFLIVFLLFVCSENVSVQRNLEAKAASRWHVPLGIFTPAVAELRVLPELHPMGRPRARHLQTDQLEGRLASVGNPQEQAGHELRDDGPCFEVRQILELSFVLCGRFANLFSSRCR